MPGVAVRLSKLAAQLLWHALNNLCACQRNWSAWGLMLSKIRSRLTLLCAWKLIYVHRTSRQCSWQAA